MESPTKHDIILLNFELSAIKWTTKFLTYIGVVAKGHALSE